MQNTNAIMSLVKGIQLCLSPSVMTGERRIWLSQGTRLTTQKDGDYLEQARLPTLPWQVPSLTETHLLLQHRPPLPYSLYHQAHDWNRTIAITTIPNHILAPLRQLGVSNLQTQKERDRLVRHSDYQAALDVVLAYLAQFHPLSQSLINTGITVNSSNLPTVTINPQTQEYIGLHLDSWDLKPLPQRHQSTNRICINLGQSDRFLLFINLTLMDMFQILEQGHWPSSKGLWQQMAWGMERYILHHSNAALTISPPQLIQSFMQHYPSYPVVKVRVAPGEAYIAPTENMIHDGCTDGQTTPDIPLTFRGHIQLPQSAIHLETAPAATVTL